MFNLLILLTLFEFFLFSNSAKYYNEESLNRSKRTARRDIPLYPLPIPFKILSDVEPKLIKRAFKDLGKLTCLTFTRKEVNSKGLVFELGEKNRVSSIGANPKAPTFIKMKKSCIKKIGCIKHLLGLALGLILEIDRHDRDNYIQIFWKNITKADQHYFKKVQWRKSWIRNTGFDYGSIMTTPITWKSKNGLAVFKSQLSKYYDFMVGQRYDYSFNDIKHLNDLYCGKVCKRRVKGCTNGGYVDPKKCKKCRCPDGFSGQQCTGIRRSNLSCGKRMLRATSDFRELYVNGTKDCIYYIKSNINKKIRIVIAEIDTKSRKPCWKKMGLEIKYRHNKGSTGLCLCGHYRKYVLNPFNSRVLVHYTGQSENDKLHLRYKVA